MLFRTEPTKYFMPCNMNPSKNHVGDCLFRSLTKIMSISYQQSQKIFLEVWSKHLDNFDWDLLMNYFYEECGFIKCDTGLKQQTIVSFVKSHPSGKYLLISHGHASSCINGKIYDTWDPCRRLLTEAYQYVD